MTVELSFGKVTGDKATLNYLVSALFRASSDSFSHGYPLISEQYKHDSYAIYDALDAAGYYDDVREDECS